MNLKNLNTNTPGYRFQEKAVKEQKETEHSKRYWKAVEKRRKKNKKICSVCGKPYEMSLRIHYSLTKGEKPTCTHDAGGSGLDPTALTSSEKSRIESKLGKNEFAVKHNGLIHIVERQ